MTDTIQTKINITRETWDRALETCKIVEITPWVKVMGLPIKCKVVVTNGVFRHLFPWGEDSVKGIRFEQRVEDVLKKFEESSRFAAKEYIEFDYKFMTYIKSAKKHNEIRTFNDGKPRDKTLELFTVGIFDDNGNKALLIGVKNVQVESVVY